MSSFAEVEKYLGRNLARVSTDDDLKQSSSLPNPLKYKQRTRSLSVSRVPYYFQTSAIPTILIYGGGIGWQWNYSFPWSFRITKLIDPFLPLCIRWRNGETVTRYKLSKSFTDANHYLYPTDVPLLNAPMYTNQVIPQNFVIEFWTPYITGFIEFSNILKFYTDKLTLPAEAGDQEYEVPGGNPTFVSPELYTALPENIPTDYNILAQWLDNA